VPRKQAASTDVQPPADAGAGHNRLLEAARSRRAEAKRTENQDSYFHRFALRLLPRPEPGRGRLIDLGCGRGEFMRLAARRGWQVQGADVASGNVEHCRAAALAVQAVDLNEPLPWPDGSFDCVTMVEVIEHVVNTEGLLEEIFRVLAPGGRLLLTTPNIAFYKFRQRALMGKAPPEEGYSVRYFIKRKLTRLLHEAGFALTRAGSFGYPPFMNMLLLRRLLGREKIRLVVPSWLETLFAEHFAWLFEKPSDHSSGGEKR